MTRLCGSGTAPDRALHVISQLLHCCLGAANHGPTACTCWEPVYDLEQAEPDTTSEPFTWPSMCDDCAHRPDSPERQDATDYLALPEPGETFWCHRGMRKPLFWQHPLGITVEAGGDFYDPPILIDADGDGVPYRAHGTAAGRCAGQEAANRRLLGEMVTDIASEAAR